MALAGIAATAAVGIAGSTASWLIARADRANQRAVDWYSRLGYVEDEFSPGPRKFRNGTAKEPSYFILSKGLKT